MRDKKSGNEVLAARLRPIATFEAMLRGKASPTQLLSAARSAADALSSETAAMIGGSITSLEEAIARGLSELEADLRDLSRKHGWRLEGIWPTFQVERGVELRVEVAKAIVRVGGTPFDATDIESIEGAIAQSVRDLLPKPFSAHEMLEQLRRAHCALGGPGKQVPILDLYGRYVIDSQSARFWRDARSERFTGMSLDQFRARLSQMLGEGATVARDGSELRLLPPLDPKNALFVYLPAEDRFGYVGRVEFVEPNAGDRP